MTKKLMIDPPSGWRYGFPKELPEDQRSRATEWLIEQGYPKWLTEGNHFDCRMWEEDKDPDT
jgi:hypothetical protein